MAPTTSELTELDREHVWHPFTQQRGWERDEPPVFVERAEGFLDRRDGVEPVQLVEVDEVGPEPP